MNKFAPTILRIGLSLVFIWFGSQQLMNTQMWTSMIPQIVMDLSGLTASTLVHFNGAFEIVFGTALFFGFYTRAVALLLALHMIDITFVVGFDAIGVRDFGLSIATFTSAMLGAGALSVDLFFEDLAVE
jgi:uncharacterized membrane protein YphA (DoxX/SURF4 family)